MTDRRTTEKMLPVLIGGDYEHIMARAVIDQTAAVRSDTTRQILKPATVVITITAEGGHAQMLGDYVAATEIVALSFEGVPVKPHTRQTENG